MTTTLVIGAVFLLVIAGAVWLAFRSGVRKAQLEISEKENEERARDAEISAKPDINNPAAAMRRLRRKD